MIGHQMKPGWSDEPSITTLGLLYVDLPALVSRFGAVVLLAQSGLACNIQPYYKL